jgi:hypothetical protein
MARSARGDVHWVLAASSNLAELVTGLCFAEATETPSGPCMLIPGGWKVTVGYSGTPLPKKLGIKPGMSMVVLNAPPNLDVLLGELPDRVAPSTRLSGHHDLVLIFVIRQADFAARIADLTTAIAPDGMIWVAWPKRASKIETDMTENVIREIVLPSSGLVDVKVCAIDHVWSGLKLVIRKELR